MSVRLCVCALIALTMVAGTTRAFAGFSLEDDGKTVTISEDGQEVLCYNYGRIDPPDECKADPGRYWRSSYIHPLYGLDGDVLTQDFPPDHYHHRGVYWTWPRCKVGDRPMDIWTIVGARQLFQKWKERTAADNKAVVEAENAWLFDDDPEPKVRETVRFIVHPATDLSRSIDFSLKFENICDENVVIRGQTTKNKGYGGFCVRPDARRRPLTFTSAQGRHKRDALDVETPWADVSSQVGDDEPISGVAIFQNPANPGYPHPGWIFRHYGFLGASWPHVEGHELAPGESVVLKYRLYIHRGNADKGGVEPAFEEYVSSHKGG